MSRRWIRWAWRLAEVTKKAEETCPRRDSASRGPNAPDDTTVRGQRALALRQACREHLESWWKATRYLDSANAPEEHPDLANALRGYSLS